MGPGLIQLVLTAYRSSEGHGPWDAAGPTTCNALGCAATKVRSATRRASMRVAVRVLFCIFTAYI